MVGEIIDKAGKQTLKNINSKKIIWVVARYNQGNPITKPNTTLRKPRIIHTKKIRNQRKKKEEARLKPG